LEGISAQACRGLDLWEVILDQADRGLDLWNVDVNIKVLMGYESSLALMNKISKYFNACFISFEG
jgi:hypothetical protein